MLTRNASYSARPEAAERETLPGGLSRLLLRRNIREEAVIDGEESYARYLADEAGMILYTEDIPDAAELEEDFDAWFELAAAWEPARQKTASQMQTEIEYIAAMCGIKL